jgi:hypothetical protein
MQHRVTLTTILIFTNLIITDINLLAGGWAVGGAKTGNRTQAVERVVKNDVKLVLLLLLIS